MQKDRKNTRFCKVFVANKILALYLRFARVQNTHIFTTAPLTLTFFFKIGDSCKFFEIFLENTRIVILAIELFTRMDFYSHKSQKAKKCSLLPRFFSSFSRLALSRTFFYSLFFTLHARKKRISEEKKTYGLSRKGLTTPLGNFDQDSSTVLYRYGDVGYIFYIICFNLAF